ncbi:MAG: metallophosphoesterase [Clostridia bacterium]|nr:metallophosphoesterase [Clostridia bacterium]
MSIYVIGDLHLSFSTDKPMDIFGKIWENHSEKVKQNWIKKVTENDTVILPGDFSWATYLENTYNDFEYLNSLPGKKIMLKGNHDYWWSTLAKMNKYLKENNFENIEFLCNNSFCIEDKIIVGTRGWINTNLKSEENKKILKRENARLKLSIEDGIKKFGENKDIIAFLHYPPFYKENVVEEMDFIKTLKKYNVKKCYYGHLHGESHREAIEGLVDGIEYKLVSSDYMNFELLKID